MEYVTDGSKITVIDTDENVNPFKANRLGRIIQHDGRYQFHPSGMFLKAEQLESIADKLEELNKKGA
jgi:hypothetical protein